MRHTLSSYLEPMTGPQGGKLRYMAAIRSLDIPFVSRANHNGQNVTKAEASTLIGMIKDGVRPSMEYLDSLGRLPFLVRIAVEDVTLLGVGS